MDQEDEVHTYNEVQLDHEKEWNNAICSNMDRLRAAKWRKKKANIVWYHLSVESQMWQKWTYLQNRNWLRNKEQTCGCQGEMYGGEVDWEFGLSRCKLLHGE